MWDDARMTNTAPDPYGLEYGDWEEPYGHDDCTGCAMCAAWEGRSYEQIRAERLADVARRRAAQPASPGD